MIKFYKYQGAGNDFVIIDNRFNEVKSSKEELAKQLCDRNFGIGSDGLILIEDSSLADFKMDFLNPDGSRSFCGNGSRCAVRFVNDQKIVASSELTFEAVDGIHSSLVFYDVVKIKMNDVHSFDLIRDDFLLNTGSPHYVTFKKDIQKLDVVALGKAVRYSDRFKVKGVNYNVAEKIDDKLLSVRTYERGVENETLACGTGITACVLSFAIQNKLHDAEIHVKALGGDLSVSFEKKSELHFINIWLNGPAVYVFEGEINV